MSLDDEYTDTAEDDLSRLSTEARARLVAKFEDATEWPDHYLKRLSSYPYYSLRAGDYRAVVDWDETNDVLTMLMAEHRDQIYDRLP